MNALNIQLEDVSLISKNKDVIITDIKIQITASLLYCTSSLNLPYSLSNFIGSDADCNILVNAVKRNPKIILKEVSIAVRNTVLLIDSNILCIYGVDS